MTNKKENRWKRFGRLLKEARMAIIDPLTREPLQMKDAAQRAGISRVQWSRYENGASGIKSITIPQIARALGRTTEDEINEVFRWAGFYTEEEPFRLPPSMRHFTELPVEIQREIANRVEREYDYQQMKKEKQGRR